MNTTTLHGWVPEPDSRGTWSILWSCLVTIAICIWSALHLDVPKPRTSGIWIIIRKAMQSLVAAMVPEYILWKSANDYIRARKTLRYLTIKQKHGDWTMTHMLFAYADGFWVRTPNGQESKCHPKQLLDLILRGGIEGPPISENELKSRAKVDGTIKVIAILQILWFVVQILARASQHYHVASLEILTVAFVLVSIFIYAVSFRKPQDVEFPVFLEIPDALHDISEPNLAGESNESGTMLHNVARTRPEGSTQTDDFDPDERGKLRVRVLLVLGCVFGAIHCLAWNASFPTSQERLAWRICSAATIAIPCLIFLTFTFIGPTLICISCFCDPGRFLTSDFIQVIYHSVALAYILGRITLVILAFIGLRALPADAFQTVNWNKYFPHFAN